MGKHYGTRSERQPFTYKLPLADLEAIISGDIEALVRCSKEAADQLYGYYERDLKINQFRAVFGHFRQIQRVWLSQSDSSAYRKLQMMKPKLYYQAARNPQLIILRDNLPPAIDKVGDSKAHFQNLMDFMEAFIAYLIAAKGSDK